jgi:chemotaxis protein methyltransferase CheR
MHRSIEPVMKVATASMTERFRGWIATAFGLHFDDDRLGFLAEVVTRHAAKAGLDLPDYLTWLDGHDAAQGLEMLALDLTVPETYFFRHMDQLRVFSQIVAPRILRAARATRELRILCVGCASGEEPYALAMLIHTFLPEHAARLRILAMDINTNMLKKAERATYSAWALRETPADMQRRWFRAVGKSFVLDATIRDAVSFKQANLAHEHGDIWAPHCYDVIFCRNVLMYFTRTCARSIVGRMTRSLASDGHLFLGHADTLHDLSDDYSLRHDDGAFYYQLRGQSPASTPATLSHTEERRRITERARSAAFRLLAPTASPAPPTAPFSALAQARQLLIQERYGAALDVISQIAADRPDCVPARLLRAAILTQQGNTEVAEGACREILLRDRTCAGAHHLLALCRDHADDADAAITHDCMAAQLDHTFAMPRLHLGIMAKRAGREKSARRELNAALVLLHGESDERILLFGGGFRRDGLINMCRSELKATAVGS